MIIKIMQYGNFHSYVRNKRLRIKQSLNSFAVDCGIDSASLSRFENGESDILFGTFLRIAKGFKMTPAELLSDFERNKK